MKLKDIAKALEEIATMNEDKVMKQMTTDHLQLLAMNIRAHVDQISETRRAAGSLGGWTKGKPRKVTT